jgi:hypothetical protein
VETVVIKPAGPQESAMGRAIETFGDDARTVF